MPEISWSHHVLTPPVAMGYVPSVTIAILILLPLTQCGHPRVSAIAAVDAVGAPPTRRPHLDHFFGTQPALTATSSSVVCWFLTAGCRSGFARRSPAFTHPGFTSG